MMKLFRITYQDDCDFEEYLTVGKNKDSVFNREDKKLQKECSCYFGCRVWEIDDIDGYKIILKKIG